jgi:3-isopropylmalate dehydratase small subunit
MSKLKAKQVPNNKGTYHVEIDNGIEKLLVGKMDNCGFVEYTEFETEKEAIEWIESKNHALELNI